jgi:hypothetical protein
MVLLPERKMNPKFILYPIFGMFVLTSLVLLRLGYLRLNAVRSKTVSIQFFKAGQGDGETPAMYFTSRNFVNLFEMPVLFYVACILFYVTSRFDNSDVPTNFIYLAWVYVGLRMIHSAIHITINKVIPRAFVFGLSQIILLILWVGLFLRLA